MAIMVRRIRLITLSIKLSTTHSLLTIMLIMLLRIPPSITIRLMVTLTATLNMDTHSMVTHKVAGTADQLPKVRCEQCNLNVGA